MVQTTAGKARLGPFLAANPFPEPLTLGFFYREKMRAIHRVAPDIPLRTILDIGGGRSGLANLLYPSARVVNIDLDAAFASAPCNTRPRVRFVCGNATGLPFPAATFDAVTMFDLIEHVPDDRRAMQEALRVLRPGGFLLLSTPNESWRFPWYSALRRICPTEEAMCAEWGHVRRGYARTELEALVGLKPVACATFISPVTVIQHDIAFSHLPLPVRRGLCMALSPITWAAYALHGPDSRGTETALCWQTPAAA